MPDKRFHTSVYRKHIRCVFIPIAVLLLHEMLIALPVVTDVGIVAGERGVAVTFSADAPFKATFSGNDKTVTATLKGCIYGLSEFSYSNFPDASPLRSITAAEGKDASVNITITMKQGAGFPLKSVQKGNQWITLLSDAASGQFSWNAGAGGGSITTPVPHVSATVMPEKQSPEPGPARLQNIRVLQRGLVGELAFGFNIEVTGKLQRSGNRVTIVIEHAISELGKRSFELPAPAPFRSVGFRERVMPGASSALDVTIEIDTARIEPDFNVAFTQGRTVSLFIMNRDNQKAMLWTSERGLTWNYEFYEVPSYKVDLESMNRRAVRDAQLILNQKKTFAVNELQAIEQKPDTAVATVVGAKHPAVVEMPSPTEGATPESYSTESVERKIMVVMADKVNLRSLPLKSGAIRKLLAHGEKVTVTGIRNGWYVVDAAGSSGYVAERFLAIEEQGRPLARAETPLPAAAPAQVKPAESITLVSAVNPSSTAVKEPPNNNAVIALSAPSDSLPGVQQAAGLKRVIRYQAIGRDPFAPIASSSVSQSGLPRIENLTLVGVLFDNSNCIALFEDRINDNQPFSFRENDPIEKGKVLKIYRDKVVFLLTEYGISRSYTLELARTTQDKEAGNK